MSMICNLRQATDEQIDQLLAHPEEIEFFLHGPSPAPKPGLLARLFGKKPQAATPPPREWTPPSADEEADLDKAWHGLHYLFTLSDWDGEEPWCYLVKGGTDVGTVDVGYGPARVLRSSEVKVFADVVARLTPEDLKARYNPEEMQKLEIYPTIWGKDPAAFDYLLGFFEILQAFLQKVAAKKMGLLIHMY